MFVFCHTWLTVSSWPVLGGAAYVLALKTISICMQTRVYVQNKLQIQSDVWWFIWMSGYCGPVMQNVFAVCVCRNSARNGQMFIFAFESGCNRAILWAPWMLLFRRDRLGSVAIIMKTVLDEVSLWVRMKIWLLLEVQFLSENAELLMFTTTKLWIQIIVIVPRF